MTRKDILSRALESLEFVVADLDYLSSDIDYSYPLGFIDTGIRNAKRSALNTKLEIKRLIDNDQH